ncbi:MAG TPA: ABC transporter permease [Candidatus Dormibacteraeota bacterium]|nr:ABC transporter permease [Candidatus Dormibacteraeota bacterium]
MKLLRMTAIAALRALRRNPLRSTLTTLGIVIGVAAVIAMVSIGRGADAAVQTQMQSLGTNLLMVMPGATTAAGVRSGWGGASTLTVGDAEALRAAVPSLAAVTYFRREIGQVVAGDKNWSTAIQGAPPSYFAVRPWAVASGVAYDERDEAAASRVALVGRTVIDQLFGPGQDPIGATIRIRDVPFRIIGVLDSVGQTMWGQDQDDVVFVPFRTAERRVLGSDLVGTIDMIQASAASPEEMAEAITQIGAVLRQRHRILPNDEDDFTVRSLEEFARASRTASQVMNNLLLAVASISLLVGGIGIMNILLVSVTERTREIGLRMAVGAKSRHILLQFLVEAVALAAVGGVLGVALGIGTAALIGSLAGWPVLLAPDAIVGALLFAAVVGIFFGFYPARKASRLDPIVALRWE